VAIVITYYTTSILTLPFANDWWIGEMPVFAIVQIPKIKLMSVFHNALVSLLPTLGLASGSASPDLILTHPWALGLTVTLPALTLFCSITLLRRVARRRILIITVFAFAFACIDAAVTFWFDSTSRLSLF
jgi:hypothetical protein